MTESTMRRRSLVSGNRLALNVAAVALLVGAQCGWPAVASPTPLRTNVAVISHQGGTPVGVWVQQLVATTPNEVPANLFDPLDVLNRSVGDRK